MVKELKEFLIFKHRVGELVKANPKRFFATDNKQLIQIYPNVYSELKGWLFRILRRKIDVNNCSTFIDTYFLLANLTLKQVMENMEIHHILKGGESSEKVFEVGGNYYSYKSPNLTNEICEQIYMKYGMSAFEKYDKDWRERPRTEFKGHEDIKVTAENIQEFFSEIIEPEKPKEVKAEIKPEIKPQAKKKAPKRKR
jgi:hypothetical protein